jgi:hypothetical protein
MKLCTLLDLTELVHHQVVQHVHDEVEMGVVIPHAVVVAGATALADVGAATNNGNGSISRCGNSGSDRGQG